jgi:hypothetical protein
VILENEVKTPMAFWKTENKIEIELVHCESRDFKGVTEFWFKSNVKISNLKITINVAEFMDIISGDDSVVIKKNEWNFLVGYENVKENQKWKFTFTGKLNNCKEQFRSVIEYKI